MRYDYPTARLVKTFAICIVGTAAIAFVGGGLLYLVLFHPDRVEGNRLLLLPIGSLFGAAFAIGVSTTRYFYNRKRPIVTTSDAIENLNLFGGAKTTLLWSQIDKISKTRMLDTIEMQDRSFFEIQSGKKRLYFDDSILDVEKLVGIVNNQIASREIAAFSIDRSGSFFRDLRNADVPRQEKRKMTKSGRVSKVGSL
jgi:hypothetical protein